MTPQVTGIIVVVCLTGLGIILFEFGRIDYLDHTERAGTFWLKLWSSPPNEIGDTLAGVFGTLAFIAAAIAVGMQSMELRAQRTELELTRTQFEDMAQAQIGQLHLLEKQGKIFETEQRERQLLAVSRLIDELIKNLRWKIQTTSIQWVTVRDTFNEPSIIYAFPTRIVSEENQANELFFYKLIDNLRRISGDLEALERRLPIEVFPHKSEAVIILDDIKAILSRIEELSPTDLTRLKRLRLADLETVLEELLSNDSLWSGNNK